MLEKTNKLKIAYIHGRPCSHPMQQKMARAIGAEFSPVDFILRWQDRPNAPKVKRYLSWILCALFFPNTKKYDIFIAAGAHITPPLMRFFRRINENQKIIVHLGDELLYTLYSGKLSHSKTTFLKKIISSYDAIISEGKMGRDILYLLLGEKCPTVYPIINGIESSHLKQVENIKPNINSKNILFMGQGPGELRFWYKGIDLLLKSFIKAYLKDNDLTLTILGDWNQNLTKPILDPYDENVKSAIRFIGYTEDLSHYLTNTALYLHPARGEAYGIAVLIALASGIPTIISEWTGTKEVVENISNNLIVPLDEDAISNKILWYFNLSDEQKIQLSAKSKKIGVKFTEQRAIKEYCETFEKIISDFNI